MSSRPHFVAGIIMRDGRCIQAAPILKWCRGACRATLSAEFRRKGWVGHGASLIAAPAFGPLAPAAKADLVSEGRSGFR